MKMKKKLSVLFTALLLLSLTACGGSDSGGIASDSSASQAVPSPSVAGNMDMGWESAADYDYVTTDDAPRDPAAPEEGYGGVPASAKIIYTADLDLETKEFDDASQALTAAVEDLGGYFESRTVSQGGRYRYLHCTVRVPAANYSAFLDRAGEAAHMTDRSEYTEDVSEVYYDQEARLTTQRTKLARLQELLAQAEDMADIITIESAISDTELQIEYLTGSLRKYDSLINYSTVNVTLREVYRLSTDEEVPQTFGDRFASAFLAGFQNGLASLDDLAIFIARNWMMLLLLAAIIVVLVLVFRSNKRKRAAARADMYPPKAGPQGAPAKREEEPAEKNEKEDEVK